MITEEKCFSAACDGCNEIFEGPFSGFTMWPDQSTVVEALGEGGWYFGDDNDDNKDKVYCEQCHHHDDEDVLQIHPKTTSNLKGKEQQF